MTARVLYDAALPGVEAVLGDLAQCIPCDAAQLNPVLVRDHDALLIRSVTRVDASFVAALHGGRLRIVCTATSGEDHVDVAALGSAGIGFASAKGCNADAVAQWVMWSLARLREELGPGICACVGIVGLGHTGRRVAHLLRTLKVALLASDPPLAIALAQDKTSVALQGPSTSVLDALPHEVELVDLEELLQRCSAVTLHVPLTRRGAYPTAGMIRTRPPGCSVRAWLNAARGGVLEEPALLLQSGHSLTGSPRAALDAWSGEPNIDESWLAMESNVSIATPHIAGHTLEAKRRALTLLRSPLAAALGVVRPGSALDAVPLEPHDAPSAAPRTLVIDDRRPTPPRQTLDSAALGAASRRAAKDEVNSDASDCTSQVLDALWRLLAHDPELSALETELRASVRRGDVATTFHRLRSASPARREWSWVPVHIANPDLQPLGTSPCRDVAETLLAELGFQVGAGAAQHR